MPFITEELWQRLERPGKSIALELYPKWSEDADDQTAERNIRVVQTLVTGIRIRRAEVEGDNRKRWSAHITDAAPWWYDELVELRAGIERLANVTLNIGSLGSPAISVASSRAQFGVLGPDPDNPDGPSRNWCTVMLDIPPNQLAPVDKVRINKEIEQLEKVDREFQATTRK